MALKQSAINGKPRGNPTKLTPELTAKFADWIRKGNTFKATCYLCQINPTTFYTWMRAGEQGHNQDTIVFFNAVMQADAEHEAAIVEQWEKINGKMLAGKTKTDWRSQQALLTYRHKWAPPPTQTQTQITQDINVNVAPNLTNLTAVELELLASLLNKTTDQPLLESPTIIDAESEEVD